MRSRRRREAQRHLRGDARTAVENPGESDTRNVKMPGYVSDVHPLQVFLKDLAGVRRIVYFRGHFVLAAIPSIARSQRRVHGLDRVRSRGRGAESPGNPLVPRLAISA